MGTAASAKARDCRAVSFDFGKTQLPAGTRENRGNDLSATREGRFGAFEVGPLNMGRVLFFENQHNSWLVFALFILGCSMTLEQIVFFCHWVT